MYKTGLVLSVLIVASRLALAAGPFEGRYAGQSTWAGNGNARCVASTDVAITVTDGKFNFGPADARTPVTVGANGSFSGQAGLRYLQGRIQGNQMMATLVADRCNYQ